MDKFLSQVAKISRFSEMDSEKQSSFGFLRNSAYSQNTQFQRKEEAKEDYINFYNDSFDSTIRDISKENSDDPNSFYRSTLTKVDNSSDKFIINELSDNELLSINANNVNKKSSDSNQKNIEIVIEPYVSTIKQDDNALSIKKTPKGSKIFEEGQYDDYSSKKIKEVLNGKNFNDINEESESDNDEEGIEDQKRQKKPKKRKRNINRRKQNSDNIRKKVKGRFLKSLKKIINKNLKNSGSKYFFSFFPQPFTCNPNKEPNRAYLDMTLRQIYLTKFGCEKSNINADANLKKYKHNKFVLNYLENNNNKKISEKSHFNVIKNKKLSEIFKEYIISKEFGKEISSLKYDEKELDSYINRYIIKAYTFLSFYYGK